MTDKKNHTVSQFFLKMIMIIPTVLGIIHRFFMVVELEAHQARRSLTKIIILMILSLILLSSTWLCLLALAYVYLISIAVSPLLSVCFILLINIILLLIVLICISRYKADLFFPETFHMIHQITGKKATTTHGE